MAARALLEGVRPAGASGATQRYKSILGFAKPSARIADVPRPQGGVAIWDDDTFEWVGISNYPGESTELHCNDEFNHQCTGRDAEHDVDQ